LLTDGLDNEAIVVTFDYRLGVFGWAAGSALLENSSEPVGNYGLLDQMAAINWVKKYIHAFNGDADNITVMGHSAGSISASYLQLIAPELAAKWVLLSGNAFGWKWRKAGSKFEDLIWRNLAERVECDPSDVEGMRRVDASLLVSACNAFHGDYLFGPTIDGKLIVDEPSKLTPKSIGPTIVTVVRDEASVFLSDDEFNSPLESIKKDINDEKIIEGMIQMMQDDDPAGFKISKFKTSTVSAVLTDTLFIAPSISYSQFLMKNGVSVFRTLFDHPLALPSFASVMATGRDYGVFHGSDIVLLFNFSPLVSMPSWNIASDMRAGLKRFMLNSAVKGEDLGVWSDENEMFCAALSRFEKYWSTTLAHPPLVANFGSSLPMC
jgi:carboxylesterase type B